MDFTTVSVEELQKLRAEITAEIRKRERESLTLPDGHDLYTLQSGAMFYVGPFHPQVKEELKTTFNAAWKTATITGEPKDGWSFDPSHTQAVVTMLNTFYGELVEQIITIHQPESTPAAPTIDGWELAKYSRDHAKPVSPFRAEGFILVAIIDQRLKPGGSKNYPKCSGMIKVRVRCRPNPNVLWGDDADVTIEES